MLEQQQLFKLDSRKYNRDLILYGSIEEALADQNAPIEYIERVLKKESQSGLTPTKMRLKMHEAHVQKREQKKRLADEKRRDRLNLKAKNAREKRLNNKRKAAHDVAVGYHPTAAHDVAVGYHPTITPYSKQGFYDFDRMDNSTHKSLNNKNYYDNVNLHL